ncbi:Prepilin peptidase PppA [Phycisphaerales bacterium]|nr:Prepilin peptidase PppA [Phycisphaerales bacterium]
MTLALTRADLLIALFPIVQVLWVAAFGACVGSLLNVLVYRLPLGLDVVTPSSRCPNCETKLTWRENIPIFGWLMLRGRCRFCRSPISAEYPIVEAFTAVLWAAVFVVLYADQGRFLGIPVGRLGPDWGQGQFTWTWPSLVVVLALFSCLIAVTLIDARTFHIPLSLLIVPVVIALAAHPLHALWVHIKIPSGRLPRVAAGWEWTIATPGPHGWRWIGAAIGGTVGLVISNLLLWKGLIKRSFADYDDWLKTLPATATTAQPHSTADAAPADSPEMWTQYPHARREMFRELIFLAPAIGLAMVGTWAAFAYAGPWKPNPVTISTDPTKIAPLWLSVLSGVLLGYLIGGGVVWAMRIAGSLAFGKEALGLGDVHLMAAVGACLGWIDSTLAFFGAAFVGVAWAILGRLFSGVFRRHMPFGPYLAIATVLVWFSKPGIAHLLTLLSKARPPLALP